MAAQAEFDERYVGTEELCRVLGVTKAMITHAWQGGRLPVPVRVGRGIMVWPRAEAQPYLDRWLAARAA